MTNFRCNVLADSAKKYFRKNGCKKLIQTTRFRMLRLRLRCKNHNNALIIIMNLVFDLIIYVDEV